MIFLDLQTEGIFIRLFILLISAITTSRDAWHKTFWFAINWNTI